MIRDGLTDAMQGKVIALLFVEFLSSRILLSVFRILRTIIFIE